MKKRILSAIILSAGLALAGCSQAAPIMYVEDGRYNLTAQAYIDLLNEQVEAQNDSRYLEIPDYTFSGDTIDIDGTYLTVRITADDAGKIEKIRYSWNGGRSGVGYSIGLYMGMTAEMLAEGESGPAMDALDMMDYTVSSYETSYEISGSVLEYSSTGHAEFNYLTIRPE